MIVSIILPTYNEAENIIDFINNVIENIPPEWDYEVIVVDDNSPDQTYQSVLNAFKDNKRVHATLRTTNRGLANSIRVGIENASGDQILVMDTDFTHNPVEIPKLLHVGKVYDIVSGSRFCAGGNMDDLSHYYSSLIYNWLIRVILRTQIQDNLGGYFTISKMNMMKLPLDKIFFGFGDYYFRLLHYAQVYGISIVEIPAIYNVRRKGESKTNILKLVFSYTVALIKFKRNMTNQKYKAGKSKNTK